jgi:glutathione S-transferase
MTINGMPASDTVPTITAFAQPPDRGQGLVRDMGVRWAFEELGLAYKVDAIGLDARKGPEHRARQPFGQIPTYRDGTVNLFESGAIVLHLAEHHPGLLPSDPAARARAKMWLIAALSTVEPPIMELSMAFILERDEPWYAARRPMLLARVETRLSELAGYLGDTPWLEGTFSAGDLMMVTVLRRLRPSGVLDTSPTVSAYVTRAEARPAFVRAFAAQLAAYEASIG